MRRREFITLLGGAAAWPHVARAQQRALPVIGYLSVETGPELFGSRFPAFLQGLNEQGYIEGRNVAIEYRFSGSQYDQLPKLAADLVGRKVAVIAAFGTSSALAAKDATATIPIVGMFGTDPVDIGAVSSLNRPTGNITGVYSLQQAVTANRFQLLHEIAPSAGSIGLLANPAGPITEAEKREAGTAAQILGVQLVILDASTPAEIIALLCRGEMLAAQASANCLLGRSTRHNRPSPGYQDIFV
jgi:putative ABC transport system substrate-binding protein